MRELKLRKKKIAHFCADKFEGGVTGATASVQEALGLRGEPIATGIKSTEILPGLCLQKKKGHFLRRGKRNRKVVAAPYRRRPKKGKKSID